MYTVYVLKSQKKQWYYVGLTDNVERRLRQHNGRQSKATKGFAPFDLIYAKEFAIRLDARDFEKYLKISSNKEKLIRAIEK